jgi:transcriptional regulator with XRE-family HTH domain
LLGLTQEALGETLGLTFQQVQKYENGKTRISASRLQHLSQAQQQQKKRTFDVLQNADIFTRYRGLATGCGRYCAPQWV